MRRPLSVLLILVATCASACGDGSEPADRAASADQHEIASTGNGVAASSTDSNDAQPQGAEQESEPVDLAAVERAAERAVSDYYEALDVADYGSAWDRLGSRVRDQLGGWDVWLGGYASTSAVEVEDVAASATSARSATVFIAIRSRDQLDCGEAVRHRFSGSWEINRRTGSWKASEIQMRKDSGRDPEEVCAQQAASHDQDEPDIDAEGYDPPPASYEDDLPYYGDDDEGSYYDPSYGDEDEDYYSYPSYGDEDEDDYGYPPTTEDFGSGRGRVGLCRDGTLSDSIGVQGACSHHGGVAP